MNRVYSEIMGPHYFCQEKARKLLKIFTCVFMRLYARINGRVILPVFFNNYEG